MLGILTFCSIFTLISAGGFLLFNREKKPRISSIYNDLDQPRTLGGPLQHAGASLGTFVSRFDSVVPRSQKDVSILRQRLIRAGLRERSAERVFYGSKVLLMLVFLMLVLTTGLASVNYFMVIAIALGVGFVTPDFWLTRRIKARKRQIRLALPDVLDLLVVCVEAGLSLDLALSRAAQEIAGTRSAISDEFSVVRLEQCAGCSRTDAWKHLAERTGVDSIRYLASMLIQAEQLGTSISRSLRVYSQTLRTQRVQQLEEQAAKAGIKIVFPLALCIFPNLFLVVLGPALMEILDSLKGINH